MGWQAATRTESISAWLRGEGRDRGWTGETGLSRLLQLFHIDPYRHYCFKDHAWNDFSVRTGAISRRATLKVSQSGLM